MRKLILTLMMGLAACIAVQAQTSQVTGTVTDSAGNPLAGASVNVRGVKRGTSAGPDGSFRLVVPANATLVVSAVGFMPREVTVGEGNGLAIRLSADRRSLNEVVVTALGIRREKRSLTNATQTIGSDELNK